MKILVQNLIQKKSKGQTLIETLAALFILIMGVSAAAGLAIYTFSSSTSIVKQIVATGLAREGVEVVKNMRDINWLNDTLGIPGSGTGCYDFATSQAGQANCYHYWLGTSPSATAPYCLDPTNSATGCLGDTSTSNYSLGLDASSYGQSTGLFWNLKRQFGTSNYGVTFNPTNSGNTGMYYSNGTTACANASGMSDYCRKIVITKVTTAPYNQDTGPLLQVRSQVWWIDKKCPRVSDYSLAPAKCKTELDSYLTNWKNY